MMTNTHGNHNHVSPSKYQKYLQLFLCCIGKNIPTSAGNEQEKADATGSSFFFFFLFLWGMGSFQSHEYFLLTAFQNCPSTGTAAGRTEISYDFHLNSFFYFFASLSLLFGQRYYTPYVGMVQ